MLIESWQVFGYGEYVREEFNKRVNSVRVVEFPDSIPKELRGVKYSIAKNVLSRYLKVSQTFKTLEEKYFEKEFFKLKPVFEKENTLIIFGTFSIRTRYLELIKKEFPYIKIIGVTVDKIRRIEDKERIIKNIKYFDSIFSFDSEDCRDYGMKHISTFYIENFIYCGEEKKIDLFYVGSYVGREERFDTVLNLYRYCKKNNLVSYIKLYDVNKMEKYGKKLLNQGMLSIEEYEDLVTGTPIPVEKTAELMKESKVVLEIVDSLQKAPTLRPLECLVSKTKLITTNTSIKNLDFFNDRNCYIYEESLKNLEKSFFSLPYVEIDDQIVAQYSLSKFIEKILK